MEYPYRKSPRIPNFDYSSDNYYFVTICTHDKQCLFGKPNDLNELGNIVESEILAIPSHFDGVRIDAHIVMPNHIHAIIVLEQEKTPLTNIVGLLKSGVTRKIRNLHPNLQVWQRSFHDHVIRNQISYEKIWTYVQYNAQKWEEDCFYSKD